MEHLLRGHSDGRPTPQERPLDNENLNINVLIFTPGERPPLLKGHFSDAKWVVSQEGFHCTCLFPDSLKVAICLSYIIHSCIQHSRPLSHLFPYAPMFSLIRNLLQLFTFYFSGKFVLYKVNKDGTKGRYWAERKNKVTFDIEYHFDYGFWVELDLQTRSDVAPWRQPKFGYTIYRTSVAASMCCLLWT